LDPPDMRSKRASSTARASSACFFLLNFFFTGMALKAGFDEADAADPKKREQRDSEAGPADDGGPRSPERQKQKSRPQSTTPDDAKRMNVGGGRGSASVSNVKYVGASVGTRVGEEAGALVDKCG